MTKDISKRSAGVESELGAEVLVYFTRALRVVLVHELQNEAARQVISELGQVLARGLQVLSALNLQCVGGNVYFNSEFLKLRSAAAFDAAKQIARLYDRVGINEVAFSAKVDLESLTAFLARFKEAHASSTPKTFVSTQFPGIVVRVRKQTVALNLDAKVDLARTYAQLILVLEDAVESIGQGRRVAFARVRRAVQQLATAAEGHEVLLAGLTRFPNLDGAVPMHCASVTALVVAVGLRLGLPRKDLVHMALAAVLHDIGRALEPALDSEHQALASALAIGSLDLSTDALERCAAALELHWPVSGDAEGRVPGMASRLIGVACAFDRMVFPGPEIRALRPDQAIQALLSHAGGRFDPRVVRLFTSVVGIHPVGSVVRLSGGQRAVVVALPADPALIARPTVKVVEASGQPADYLVELSREGETLRIVEALSAEEEAVPVMRFLLA